MTNKLYLNESVKKLRKHLGYTQKDFTNVLEWQAERTVSLSLYRQLEQGRLPINIVLAASIAKVLGSNVIDITERK